MGLFSHNGTNGRGRTKVVELGAAVSGLVASVLQARTALDRQVAELARQYQQDDLLRGFPLPAFEIEEITLRLPYAPTDARPNQLGASVGPEDLSRMLVQIDSEALSHLPAHTVAQIELKLSHSQIVLPQNTPKGP